MLSPYMGEFCGTAMLIILGDGVVAGTLLAKSKGHQGGWLAITVGWFVAVVIGVFVAKASGSANADINPAISFAKYLWGAYTSQQTVLFILVQVAGAFVGAVLVWLTYLPHWGVTQEADLKLMVFSTKPAIYRPVCNLMTEVIATAVLILGVAAIFANAIEGMPVAGLGAYLVGVLVWGIGLSLGGPTGYAINPARDLGPRLAHAILPITGKGSSEWGYAWVPVLGPFLGSIVAVVLMVFIR